MKSILGVALVLLAGCRDATAPRAFTLGPGCWTVNVITTTLDDGRRATGAVKAHYPVCPDSLASGQTLWHWDTTFVAH